MICLQLKNCTYLLNGIKDTVYAIVFENQFNILTKSVKEDMEKLSKQYPKANLLQSKYIDEEQFNAKTSKFLKVSCANANTLREALDLKENYVVFIAFGDKKQAVTINYLSTTWNSY